MSNPPVKGGFGGLHDVTVCSRANGPTVKALVLTLFPRHRKLRGPRFWRRLASHGFAPVDLGAANLAAAGFQDGSGLEILATPYAGSLIGLCPAFPHLLTGLVCTRGRGRA